MKTKTQQQLEKEIAELKKVLKPTDKIIIQTTDLVRVKLSQHLTDIKNFEKLIGDFSDKGGAEIIEIRDILDILRNDIRENVESVDVDGKAYSRTSDIDGSIDAKEGEIKQKWIEKLEEIKEALKEL